MAIRFEDAQALFARKVAEIIGQVDALDEDAVRRALAILEEARLEILNRLRALPPESFGAAHLRALGADVGHVISDMEARYARDFPELFAQAEHLGVAIVEDPFAAVGATYLPQPLISRTVVEVVQAYTADLITALGNEARRRINGYLAQSALGVMQPYEAIQAIAGDLPGQSVFRSLGGRAQTIYRTEVGRVFSIANHGRMAQMGQRLPRMKKRWVAFNDSRTRSTHVTVAGAEVFADSGSPTIVPHDQAFTVGGEFGMYPRDPSFSAQQSVNCFPGGTLVVAPDAIAATRRGYSGRLVQITTALGNHLAGTPNHPVLTDRGWVALGELHEGDHVVSRRLGDRAAPAPDVQHVPAPIGEVAGALAMVGTSEGRRQAAHDFHGDATDGEVEVVLAHGLLLDDVVPALRDPGSEQALVEPRLVASLLCGARPRFKGRERVLAAAAGRPGGVEQAVPLLGRRLGHANRHRLPPVTRLDAGFKEPLAEGPARDPQGLGDGLLGLSGSVTRDRVIEVRHIQFRGQVFNLQTRRGWYVAGGIIAHNCRCNATPWLDQEVLDDLGVSGVTPRT